jgi:hypothetical protein
MGRRGAKMVRTAIAWAILCLAAEPAIAQMREYEVKAAFLYNFARFVDWPAGGGVTLCLLGGDPFGGDIDIVAGKPVGTSRLQVRRIEGEQTDGCQIVFVPASQAGRLARVLDGLKGRPVLTVGDAAGFAERGAVINFYLEQNKVRFEINIDAARRTGLPISSQLLRLARITHDRTGSNG